MNQLNKKSYSYSLHLAIGNCDDDGDIESLPSPLSLQDSGILGFACDDHNKLCAVPLSICFMCAMGKCANVSELVTEEEGLCQRCELPFDRIGISNF